MDLGVQNLDPQQPQISFTSLNLTAENLERFLRTQPPSTTNRVDDYIWIHQSLLPHFVSEGRIYAAKWEEDIAKSLDLPPATEVQQQSKQQPQVSAFATPVLKPRAPKDNNPKEALHPLSIKPQLPPPASKGATTPPEAERSVAPKTATTAKPITNKHAAKISAAKPRVEARKVTETKENVDRDSEHEKRESFTELQRSIFFSFILRNYYIQASKNVENVGKRNGKCSSLDRPLPLPLRDPPHRQNPNPAPRGRSIRRAKGPRRIERKRKSYLAWP